MTVADVHRWVQKGFADALGEVHSRRSTPRRAKARNDRKARNFPDKATAAEAREITRVGAVVGMWCVSVNAREWE